MTPAEKFALNVGAFRRQEEVRAAIQVRLERTHDSQCHGLAAVANYGGTHFASAPVRLDGIESLLGDAALRLAVDRIQVAMHTARNRLEMDLGVFDTPLVAP